jgi:hydrogenase expression/formation protein HypD
VEVCGGHTHTILKFWVETMRPDVVELVHGPGCPVCVLPMGRVDDCLALAEMPGVTFTTFGDAMRVPGSKKSLLQAKAEGADARMVYSPLDALKLARLYAEKEIVFFGSDSKPRCHRRRSRFTRRSARAFLGPGHVSMVIGMQPYRFIAEHYKRAFGDCWFEPLDVLQSVWMLLKQIAAAR